MFKSVLVVAFAVATLANPALAHPPAPTQTQGGSGFRNDRGDLERMQQNMRQLSERTARTENEIAAAPTPEEAVVAAQALATGAGLPCQVTQATFRGRAAEDAYAYEAACAAGPGYILVASTPPVVMDCVVLAGQADMDRARDPSADVGAQCDIPQNTDVTRVVAAYAAEAGVACTVDQGASNGRSSNDNPLYEVGCDGAEGYWIEKTPTGWTQTGCAIVQARNQTCRFTTATERAATLGTRIDGAADCAVVESRYMGASGADAFYEAKCGAGNGFIVRLSPANGVRQVFPCEVAQGVGGGCTLTVVPPAPAAAAAPAGQS